MPLFEQDFWSAFFQEPTDYDTWFDYLRMVEQEGDSDVIRDTYERAISNIPDSSGTVHKPQNKLLHAYRWI